MSSDDASVAAFNIEGATLHSALRLLVEDGHSHAVATCKYKQLQGESLQDMQQALRGVRYLIIDEISMVSSNLLMNASKRLQKITGRRGDPFGGLSVIAFGHLYQLPPVKAPFVFHSPGGIRCQEFKMQELTSNHRQSGDTNWSDSLNILRKGLDESAVNGVYEQPKTRLGNMSGGPVSEAQFDGAMRLYPNNDKVDSYNDRELQSLVHQGVQKLRLVAGHGQIGDSGQVRHEHIDIAQIPKDKDNCGGLADVVEVAVGARVMLRYNMCTEDGLVNGAMGTIVEYDWPAGHRTGEEQPCGLSILFDNPRVGRLTRGTHEHLPTLLRPATSRFKGRHGRLQFERYQYPVTLAWAVTIHRVQGVSLDRAVIDLGSGFFMAKLMLLSLSRVRSMEGVMLVGLTRRSFSQNSPKVHQEYARLSHCPI